MNKWTNWYNSQNTATQSYLNSQPLWKDRDMIISCALGFISGVIIGAAACI